MEKEQVNFIVQQILQHKQINGINYFLVKWEGYSMNDNTWEPQEHFNKISIDKYFKQLEKKKQSAQIAEKKDKQKNKSQKQKKKQHLKKKEKLRQKKGDEKMKLRSDSPNKLDKPSSFASSQEIIGCKKDQDIVSIVLRKQISPGSFVKRTINSQAYFQESQSQDRKLNTRQKEKVKFKRKIKRIKKLIKFFQRETNTYNNILNNLKTKQQQKQQQEKLQAEQIVKDM